MFLKKLRKYSLIRELKANNGFIIKIFMSVKVQSVPSFLRN